MAFLIRGIYIKGKTPWISVWILIITFSFIFKQVILTSICTSCILPTSACNFYQVIYRSYSYCRSCRTLSCINYYKFPADITTNFDVEALDMGDGNYLEILSEGQLQKANLPNLKVLVIRRCSIYEIRLGTFYGMDSLIELDLSHNFIKYLNPRVFSGLNKLKLLNLSGNPIQEFKPESEFPVLPLIVLDLSNCKLRSVESELFQNLKTLHNIQLNHNNFTSLDWRFLLNLKRLHSLMLEDNPWHCDCHIQFLINALVAKNLAASLHLATCATTEPDLFLHKEASMFWVYNNSLMTCKPKVDKFTYASYETFQGGFNFDAQNKFGIRRISEKAKVNDEIHFECVFSGYPPPRPTFSKLIRQRIIINQGVNCPAPANQTDPLFDINRFSYREILTISSVSEEDQGQYECFVNNSVGSDSKLVDFYLIGERGTSKESHGTGESNTTTDISIESLLMENEWIAGGILAFILGVAGIIILFLCLRKKKSSHKKKPVPKINIKKDNPKVIKPSIEVIHAEAKEEKHSPYKPLLPNTLQTPPIPTRPPPVGRLLKRAGRETIIIGTDTCEVASIVSVLISAEPKDILREKLTEIGTLLNVNYHVIKNINRRLTLDTLDLCGAITEVINAWLVKKGTKDARLRTLLEVFEKLELIAFKQLLEKEFGISTSTALRLCPSFSGNSDKNRADLSACQNSQEKNVKKFAEKVCNSLTNSQTLVEIKHEARPTEHETIHIEKKAEQSSLPATTITISDANELSYDTCVKYSLKVLQEKESENFPEDVNPTQKEIHLNKEDFQRVFGMNYKEFCNHQKWKRKEMKKSAGLF